MRVAITGGTGFVGGHLAKAFVARGHEVILIARGSIGAIGRRLKSREHDSLPPIFRTSMNWRAHFRPAGR